MDVFEHEESMIDFPGSFQLDCEEPTLFIRIGTDDLCSGEGFDWPRYLFWVLFF